MIFKIVKPDTNVQTHGDYDLRIFHDSGGSK